MSKKEITAFRPAFLLGIVPVGFIVAEFVKNYVFQQYDDFGRIFSVIIFGIFRMLCVLLFAALILFICYPKKGISFIRSMRKYPKERRELKRQQKAAEMKKQIANAEYLTFRYGEEEKKKLSVLVEQIVTYLHNDYAIMNSVMEAEDNRTAYMELVKYGFIRFESVDVYGHKHHIRVVCRPCGDEVFEPCMVEGMEKQKLPDTPHIHVTSDREKDLAKKRKVKKKIAAKPKQDFGAFAKRWVEENSVWLQKMFASKDPNDGSVLLPGKNLPAKWAWKHIGNRLVKLGAVNDYKVGNDGLMVFIKD